MISRGQAPNPHVLEPIHCKTVAFHLHHILSDLLRQELEVHNVCMFIHPFFLYYRETPRYNCCLAGWLYLRCTCLVCLYFTNAVGQFCSASRQTLLELKHLQDMAVLHHKAQELRKAFTCYQHPFLMVFCRFWNTFSCITFALPEIYYSLFVLCIPTTQ